MGSELLARGVLAEPTLPRISVISRSRIKHHRFLSSRERQSQMKRRVQMKRTILLPAMAALLALMFSSTSPVSAQDRSSNSGGPLAPNEVTPGTRFLIRLDDELSTQDSKTGRRFQARTIEPIVTADGTALPAGAEVRGHIDKVEAAHKTGRARMWLTFDDIKTPEGWIPLVAMVDDVPGVHSIRVDYNREGEIEAASSKRQEALEAAAAGALVGAAAGVASHNTKDAAMGAAVAAATAYMATSGLGQELTIQKDTKIEIILERSLYFGRG
jgi:hypothetical protein